MSTAITFVSRTNVVTFDTDSKKLIENITPIIKPLNLADFEILGCIKTIFYFKIQKYKKTAINDRNKRSKGLKI